jgi:hypothetical protein
VTGEPRIVVERRRPYGRLVLNLRVVSLVLALVVAFAFPGAAREIAGVELPERTNVSGHPLVLNGAGLRTRFFFKVYVIGLYLERPATDAAAILAVDGVRRAEIHVLRALSGSEIASAIGEVFERNAGDAGPRLADRLRRFEAMFPPVERNDVILLTYVPGTGTRVVVTDKEVGVIDGKDFADVLFSVWIGRNPVDPALRDALLAAGRQ